MSTVFALIAGYVCGSFPSAYLAGRLVKGIDLRQAGSGNLGATNVYRVVGAPAAVVVLALDALKWWVAVTAVPQLFALGASEWWPVALGAAAVLGHAKPVFLLWHGGGKGVATGAGVFLALAPEAVGIATVAFVVVVALTRYVSAGSVAAAAVLPIAIMLRRGATAPVFLAAAFIGAFVIWSHRDNITRLRRGEEHKIGRPGQGTA